MVFPSFVVTCGIWRVNKSWNLIDCSFNFDKWYTEAVRDSYIKKWQLTPVIVYSTMLRLPWRLFTSMGKHIFECVSGKCCDVVVMMCHLYFSQTLTPTAPHPPPHLLNHPATATSQTRARTQSFHLAPSPPRPSPSWTSPTGKGNYLLHWLQLWKNSSKLFFSQTQCLWWATVM